MWEDRESNRARVFCIGLNKTGTSSLHVALERLGYRSLHARGPHTRGAVARALRESKPLLTYLPEYDAFSDIPSLVTRFDRLDLEYPGSRFILTVRDIEGWLASRRSHVERNIARHERGAYHGSWLTIDVDRWRSEFVDHVARVQAYFADRPDDLLTMDLARGDGYGTLCPFLGVPEPDEAFPWQQRGSRARQAAALRPPSLLRRTSSACLKRARALARRAVRTG